MNSFIKRKKLYSILLSINVLFLCTLIDPCFGVDTDFYGVPRTGKYSGDLPDIGAFEYYSETVPLGIINISSDKANGTYKAGEVIDIDLTFSEPVSLSGGNLIIAFNTGDSISISSFANQSGVSANYTVGESGTSSDLNVLSITLSAGTIKNSTGTGCSLILPSGHNLADNKNIVIEKLPGKPVWQ